MQAGIPCEVAGKFWKPVIPAGRGQMRPPAALVDMPETAVDEDGTAQARKHQIGGAWQVAAVQPEAEAEPVRNPPNRQFGTRAGAVDARHKGAAFINGEGVHGLIRPTTTKLANHAALCILDMQDAYCPEAGP